MIEIRQLTKVFDKVTALDRLDLTVENGSVTGLIGSNGGGKSTLLRLLSGVYHPDGGEILIDGAACCAAFPIERNRRIINMSKGMQRQAALIIALSTRPRYLFLDEIFDGLDAVVRLVLKRLLAERVAAHEMTVIIASHNLRELEELCDRICLLHQGRVIVEHDVDSLRAQYRKVQMGFAEAPGELCFDGVDVVGTLRTGNVVNLTIRGAEEDFMPKLQAMSPAFIAAMPLTLEEVFISEMEAAGYDAYHIN